MHHDPWTQNELQEISLQYWLHHWVCPTKGSNSILAPFIIEKSTIFMPIMELFETAGKKQTEAHEAKTGFRGMNGRCREFCSSTGRLGVCQALLLCFFSKSMLWFFFFLPVQFLSKYGKWDRFLVLRWTCLLHPSIHREHHGNAFLSIFSQLPSSSHRHKEQASDRKLWQDKIIKKNN